MSTESRRWTSGTAGHMSVGGAYVVRYSRPDLVVWASKPSVVGFTGFGPQNPGRGSDAERTARGGIGEIAWSKAIGEEARWPSDQIIPSRTKLALGLVVWLMYLGVVWARGIETIYQGQPPPFLLALSFSHFLARVSSDSVRVPTANFCSDWFVGSTPLSVCVPSVVLD